MKRNIKYISVTFTRIYDNPTFNELFRRFRERYVNLLAGVEYDMETNHTHFGKISDMASAFKYTVVDKTGE